MPVPKRIITRINAEIETTFERLRQRFFAGGDKQLRIGYSPFDGLAGLYRLATESQGGTALRENEQGLLEIASAYLEGAKARLRSATLSAIAAAQRDSESQENLPTKLADLWDKATADVERVVDTESQRARQTGSLDGIVQASAAMGVEDPVVYWVVVRDLLCCLECKRLHLMPDGITPRLYRLSEVGSDYHKRGEDQPKYAGLHPSCRCGLTTLPPGFGFTKAGMIAYRGPDHDEYAVQRS